MDKFGINSVDKTYLRVGGYEGVDWGYLVQDRDQL